MDMATTYLGIRLRNPLVASASPLSQDADGVIRLVEAGVGAVVLPSLFEEQIEQDAVMGPEPRRRKFFEHPAGPGGPTRYLALIEESAGSVDVPVIASINGTSMQGWTSFARSMEDAGAAAVECNFYFVPGHIQMPGRDVEARCLEVVHAVKQAVSVPVAVKLPPYFSSFGLLALRLVETGVDGLVLFNRFLQPQIDVESLAVSPVIGLSNRSDARLPQTWIALLREQLSVSLAGTSGVESADDLVAYLLAGADVVECASAFLRHGPEYAAVLLDGMAAWAARHKFMAVDEFRGRLAVPWSVDSSEYARDGYVASLQTARHGYFLASRHAERLDR